MVKELAVNKNQFSGAVRELDLDGDGIISKHEMAIGLQKLGVTLDMFELDAVMTAFDIDQSGTVELDEFIDAMTLYRSRLQLDQTSDTEKVEATREKDREKRRYRGPERMHLHQRSTSWQRNNRASNTSLLHSEPVASQ